MMKAMLLEGLIPMFVSQLKEEIKSGQVDVSKPINLSEVSKRMASNFRTNSLTKGVMSSLKVTDDDIYGVVKVAMQQCNIKFTEISTVLPQGGN